MASQHHPNRAPNFLIAGAGVAALAAVPFLLLELGRRTIDSANPFHGIRPPWTWKLSTIRDVLTRSLSETELANTLTRVALVATWAATAILIATVIAEAWSQIRHGVTLPHIRGFGWSQTLARPVVAAILSLVPLLHTTPAAANLGPRSPFLPRHTTTSIPINTTPTSTTVDPTVRPSAPLGLIWHERTVRQGDSIYGIASELAAGDTTATRVIAQQILDRNLGRTMTDGQTFTTPGYIEAGWTLDVPGPRPGTTKTVVGDPPARPSPETYLVEAGDSYWRIAEHHLDDLNAPAGPLDVRNHTLELIADNAPRLGRQPLVLIHPGDVIHLTMPGPQQALNRPDRPLISRPGPPHRHSPPLNSRP